MLLDVASKDTKFQFYAKIVATNSIPWVMHTKTDWDLAKFKLRRAGQRCFELLALIGSPQLL